jgi:hypothetical protein
MTALERAWSHALPGHEAVERNAMLRALQRLLDDCDGKNIARWLAFGKPVQEVSNHGDDS